MTTPTRTPAATASSVAVVRTALFFGLWLIVDQSPKTGNLVVGGLASVAATWLSLWLLPPSMGRVRLGALLWLMPRFLWQSLRAGVDVAWRVLHPALPVRLGFVPYPVALPRGSARNAFELISSLMPGSVPTDEDERTVEYHVLDTSQPVVEQLAAEEAAYAQALIPGRLND
jgi:multicomponent Na+:H+ antiporter subunit E